MTLKRTFAVGALAIVVLALAYLLFSSGGKDAEYQLLFANGDQLVLGDQVQVGGTPVGTVKHIVLTKGFKAAEVTIGVESKIVPLRKGTTAQIRVPSLSSVADRYIALKLAPNNMPALKDGATLPLKDTKVAVNLDELFNLFTPKTRKGLQNFIEGFGKQYEGTGRAVSAASRYFSPALEATNHIFEELVSDEHTFEAFLVEGAKAVQTIAAHHSELGGAVRHASELFGAVGSRQQSLETGLKELPVLIKEGNAAFKKLPPAFAALEELSKVSIPNTKTLALFFERLKPLIQMARPVVTELGSAINRPGPNNDLTDFALNLPGLATSLKQASPNGIKALEESVPVTAPFGPYAPDLGGLFRTFGAGSGYYDANGHYFRGSPDFADFKLNSSNTLVPVASPSEALEGLKSGQLARCPGSATQPAADGSSPFTDNGKLECNPAETP
ncbi:MAG TPA: MlaD family protein [Solirubrobacteraceae bacterium]|jgi:phospholipid/cholesterol/gamma-HCH transport system substrate-binding protein